jgi:cytochrome c oxidase subunit II
VFGAMFYSVFAHRRSRHPKPATFHESTLVEIIWTVLPFVVLIGMAIPATGTLVKMSDTSNSDMTIKITGYQWLWGYDYVGEGVSFYSRLDEASNAARQLDSGIDPASVENYLLNVDKPLVLPVGQKIRFQMTSADVIHAWWVPALGWKKDAIPGYVNEMWARIDEPGIYRGQCAELCGRDHGFMPIVVEALPQDEYEQWLAQQKGGDEVSQPAAAAPTELAAAESAAASDAGEQEAEAPAAAASDELSKDALMEAGKNAYQANCSACHQADGSGLPPTFPSLHGSAVVTGPVDPQIAQVLKGKNAMPPFAYLSDKDIAAAITYTRNSWGNDAGVVQPVQVAAAR